MTQPGKNSLTGKQTVNEVVAADYRAADAFRKFGISFCCGGNLPIEEVCKIQSVDFPVLLEEINRTLQPPPFRGTFGYDKWSCDFLIDFIINVHHSYLRNSMPLAVEYVSHLQLSHGKKFPELATLHAALIKLGTETGAHITQKESIIFPYIKQITHAYEKKESYAGLLVRTLKKPVANLLQAEHRYLNLLLQQMAQLSNNFTPPVNACLTHKVCFAKLSELSHNLIQQLYLKTRCCFQEPLLWKKNVWNRKQSQV